MKYWILLLFLFADNLVAHSFRCESEDTEVFNLKSKNIERLGYKLGSDHYSETGQTCRVIQLKSPGKFEGFKFSSVGVALYSNSDVLSDLSLSSTPYENDAAFNTSFLVCTDKVSDIHFNVAFSNGSLCDFKVHKFIINRDQL